MAEVRVAPGLRVEVAVTGISRPVQLAFDASGRLIVLSHGWRGDAAAEIYRLNVSGAIPLDASRAPRVVIPFAEGPRKAAFGSLAIDARSGDLFLGEENGNRIYRLTVEEKLVLFAVGLYHLVGGSSLAFDDHGQLVVLDFASREGHLRSESPLPPTLDWLTSEAYHGPLVFRLDPQADISFPRRLDLVPPVFPKGSTRRVAGELLPRFISVAGLQAGELVLLSSLGEVFKLTAEGGLHLLARLPAGHYHRTNMALAPDGSVFVSSGFHLRQVFRISPAGDVTSIAGELGDPEGIAVDPAGNLYVAETALHRIIRIRPSP
jgi:DNA-binding beta-propeller fold protein YncE